MHRPAPLPPTLMRAAAVLALGALVSGMAAAQSIYTCTDSKGRRITSDRPITDCLDREQQRMGRTGTVRETIPPSYTREERERVEAQRRAEAEKEARLAEEKRRNRALLIRYPSAAVHDKERQEALSQIDEVIAAVNKRELALAAQRKEIDTEFEFYKADPAKAPAWLKRKRDDNEKQMELQKRFLAEQEQEKKRVAQRFDEELAKLQQLWSAQVPANR
ncbi:DUF4124 domain-containing protein [Hydrogenophaga crocea]|nr:DUF4124 domain-containing protein [Hydrogenophaga crocea]